MKTNEQMTEEAIRRAIKDLKEQEVPEPYFLIDCNGQRVRVFEEDATDETD